ncbi:hypothetical protein Tco_1374822, partial [Tanacetum coccineum]
MPGRKGMGTEDVMIAGQSANGEEHVESDENNIAEPSAKGDGHKGFDEKRSKAWIKWLTPEVKGSILTPCKAGGPFLPLVEPEAASLPPQYTVED